MENHVKMEQQQQTKPLAEERTPLWSVVETKTILLYWLRDLKKQQKPTLTVCNRLTERISFKLKECGVIKTPGQVRSRLVRMRADHQQIIQCLSPNTRKKKKDEFIYFEEMQRVYETYEKLRAPVHDNVGKNLNGTQPSAALADSDRQISQQTIVNNPASSSSHPKVNTIADKTSNITDKVTVNITASAPTNINANDRSTVINSTENKNTAAPSDNTGDRNNKNTNNIINATDNGKNTGTKTSSILAQSSKDYQSSVKKAKLDNPVADLSQRQPADVSKSNNKQNETLQNVAPNGSCPQPPPIIISSSSPSPPSSPSSLSSILSITSPAFSFILPSDANAPPTNDVTGNKHKMSLLPHPKSTLSSTPNAKSNTSKSQSTFYYVKPPQDMQEFVSLDRERQILKDIRRAQLERRAKLMMNGS